MNVLWLSILFTKFNLEICMANINLIPWSEEEKFIICIERVKKDRFIWERNQDILTSQRRLKPTNKR
jgi:hypothetical protein